MDTFKKIIATICAGLFVISAIIALFAFNFDRQAFTSDIYQKVFANEDFYNRLPSVMAEAAMSADLKSLPIVMQGMTTQAWEAFFRALLPQDMLKTMGNDALNSTLEYLNMQTDSAQLPLVPLKANMTSDIGVQAVFALLDMQPDCTLGQLAQMALNLQSNSAIQFCKPPTELNELLTPIIKAQLQAAALAIPDQITLVRAPAENDPRQKLKTARTFMKLSPILPLGFLFLLSILTINSLKSWLDWWGVPFLVAGSIAAILGLSGAPVISAIIRQMIEKRIPFLLPAVMVDFADSLARAMIQALFQPILAQGLVLAAIGLAMVMISFFIKRNKRKSAAI